MTTNRDRQAVKGEFIDQLVAEMSPGEDMFGLEGSFTRLKGAVMERLLQAELANHLEHPAEEPPSMKNGRNGFGEKTVRTESGPVRMRVPRDREGTLSRSWSRSTNDESKVSTRRSWRLTHSA